MDVGMQPCGIATRNIIIYQLGMFQGQTDTKEVNLDDVGTPNLKTKTKKAMEWGIDVTPQ